MSDEFRKARLNHYLTVDFDGVQVALAAYASRGEKQYSRARISQMAGPTEPFGEKAARPLEVACGLPEGWFDNNWPTPWELRQQGAQPERQSAQEQKQPIPSISGGRSARDLDAALRVLAAAAQSAKQEARDEARPLIDLVVKNPGVYADGQIPLIVKHLSGESVEQQESLKPSGTGP